MASSMPASNSIVELRAGTRKVGQASSKRYARLRVLAVIEH